MCCKTFKSSRRKNLRRLRERGLAEEQTLKSNNENECASMPSFQACTVELRGIGLSLKTFHENFSRGRISGDVESNLRQWTHTQ